jgi:hypothetical protein
MTRSRLGVLATRAILGKTRKNRLLNPVSHHDTTNEVDDCTMIVQSSGGYFTCPSDFSTLGKTTPSTGPPRDPPIPHKAEAQARHSPGVILHDACQKTAHAATTATANPIESGSTRTIGNLEFASMRSNFSFPSQVAANRQTTHDTFAPSACPSLTGVRNRRLGNEFADSGVWRPSNDPRSSKFEKECCYFLASSTKRTKINIEQFTRMQGGPVLPVTVSED